MKSFKVILKQLNDACPDDDLEIQRALLSVWRELRLVAHVERPDASTEEWLVWGDSPAMVKDLMQWLPGLRNETSAIASISETAGRDAAPQPPHEKAMPVRQLRGLSIDEVFPHYDNDDMGLEERFHYLWILCCEAESAILANPGDQAAAYVKRMRQGVAAMARALNAYYNCPADREAERIALQQRAVWLTEVGVDPEAALRIINGPRSHTP